MAKPRNRNPRPLPSKEEVLEFIGSRSGKVGRREIARAFSVAPGDRAALTALLRELDDEGTVERRHKKLHRAGHLPSTVLADVTARDLAPADFARAAADELKHLLLGGKGARIAIAGFRHGKARRAQ